MNKKIALFVGDDIHSLITYQTFINNFKKSRFILVFPVSKFKKNTLPKDLKTLRTLERTCLKNFVFKYIDCNNCYNGLYKSHDVFVKKDNIISVYKPENINDDAFIEKINDVDGIISIRCYQKFSGKYVAKFNTPNKFLLNLHPGDLPQYRGVMTLFRSMSNFEKEYAISLHEMDENWDAGPILSKYYSKLDYSKSYLENMVDAGNIAGEFLSKYFLAESTNKPIKEIQKEYQYWGFPNQNEIDVASSKKIRLYNMEKIIDNYFSLFVGDQSLYNDYKSKFLKFLGDSE